MRALRHGLAAVLFLSSTLAACTCGGPAPDPFVIEGDGFLGVFAEDGSTVKLVLSRPVDRGTVKPAAFQVRDFTVVPPAELAVSSAEAQTDTEIALSTSGLQRGVEYTLVVRGLKDSRGNSIEGTLNFTPGSGSSIGEVVPFEVVIDDVEKAREWEGLRLLATVGADGAFAEVLVPYDVVDEGDRFVATLSVAVDPARTVDATDDAESFADRRAYAVLLVDGDGRLASALTPFALRSPDDPRALALSIFPAPDTTVPGPVLPPAPEDPSPGDGNKVVRLVVDDSASRELVSPQIAVSFQADGSWVGNQDRLVDLTPIADADYAGWYEAVVELDVDPARVADGTSPDTLPYIVSLVDQGVVYPPITVNVVAPDEVPQTIELPLGNPAWTPVTFRVDVSGAYLKPDGSQKGVYPGEAVFVTGEWGTAVDAFGNNCGDGFRGGENLCLKMRQMQGNPGVWTRTIWLPPGRPYGWKVVRCDAAAGCGPLNTLVTSSGRAFATVMKNLATDNADAFADPGIGIVDPLDLANVTTGGGTLDYTGASVYVGQGVGSEEDPAGTPDGQRMFKQEVPDLVVIVGDDPLVTRVMHVGTWRDVNLPNTPQEIVAGSLTVDLTLYDYDDGFIGRFPNSRAEP